MVRLAAVARILTKPFIDYDIRGGECVADLHVAVVAVNHRSMFDVVAGLIGLDHFGRYPRLLIAERYVQGRWTAPFARAIGAIPVPPRERRDEAVQRGMEVLREGVPLLVMPEGHLHFDPADPTSTGSPRPGVSRFAVGASTIVMPVGLSGTEAVWPSTSPLPRLNPFRRKVVVVNVANEPLRLRGDDHQANAEEVMAAIRSLLVEAPGAGNRRGGP